MSQDSSDASPPVHPVYGPPSTPRGYGPPSTPGERPGQMAVAPDDLQGSIAPAVHHEGTELEGILIRKMEALLTVGNFWGDDKPGTKFYNGDAGMRGYAATLEEVLTEAQAISTFYAKVAIGLHAMGTNVNDAEIVNWHNIGDMPKIPKFGDMPKVPK
ncbi:hypothetical protein ACQPYK_39220 [Streptosporangium sp. CA-135522]|uniref:hypothetical protein n=1 Tax=Streptosporangium sp. CA-135522 TaxID=3240072 RepID=UPI003D9189AC